ncbi:MAG: DUF2855 family protein [Parvularcula sp.]|jgi:hypothetical protein|nr:DUF2855 family protein [Parvularcula sp.]
MTKVWTLEVRKDALGTARVTETALSALGEGETLIEVENFGLTANNVTYGLVGEQIGYWQFFPASEAGWGIIPVWGFGRVIQSRSDDLEEGERLFGYFPMGTHLRLTPSRRSGQIMDQTPHRQGLPAAYNRYRLIAEDPPVVREREAQRAILFPLFATSYVIADWLQDNAYFGAEQVVVTSASSKTGLGVGMALGMLEGAPRSIGVTSPANEDFVSATSAFGAVASYGDIDTLPQAKTALIDMSGNAEVITAVHERMGEGLVVSSIVGATHWDAERQQRPLPGAKPTVFFAPTQIEKRDKELGGGAILLRALTAWAEMSDALADHLIIERHTGPQAVQSVWEDMVAGRVTPDRGIFASMRKD